VFKPGDYVITMYKENPSCVFKPGDYVVTMYKEKPSCVFKPGDYVIIRKNQGVCSSPGVMLL